MNLLYIRLVGVLVVALLALGGGWWISHIKGQLEDALEQKLNLTAKLDSADNARLAVTHALEGYSASTTKTQVVTKEILREVTVRIPADACPLPPAWGLLHNAAAAGAPPGPAGEPDAGPAGPEAVAR